MLLGKPLSDEVSDEGLGFFFLVVIRSIGLDRMEGSPACCNVVRDTKAHLEEVESVISSTRSIPFNTWCALASSMSLSGYSPNFLPDTYVRNQKGEVSYPEKR